MELDQRFIISFLDRDDAGRPDIQTRPSPQFGDAAYSLRSVQRWRQYVQQGREFVDNEPRSGRSPIDSLGIQILSCLEKQLFRSAYSLTEGLNVSHRTILNQLRDWLGMKLLNL
jgi:hypothetical protein